MTVDKDDNFCHCLARARGLADDHILKGGLTARVWSGACRTRICVTRRAERWQQEKKPTSFWT